MKKYSNEEYKALLTEIENIDFAEVKLENECEERVCSDLNLWDGRRHQMKLHEGYGVYELFIPGLEEGTLYKYEIKKMNGDPILKADPYANYG